MTRALFIAAVLCTISGTGFGSGIDISVSRMENSEDNGDFIPSRYFSFGVASRFEIKDRVALSIKGEYGSGDTETAVAGVLPEAIYDSRGRIWSVEAAVDYTPFSRFFFMRASAGVGYLLHDYAVNEIEYDTRFAFSETEALFTAGVGTRFPVDGIPVLDSMHFLVSMEKLGDSSLVSGEIGIGL